MSSKAGSPTLKEGRAGAEPELAKGGRIRADNLGKTYRLYEAPSHRLLEVLTRRKRHREHHALRNVSFELEPGESLGVVGQNGAGKSTLLKLLAGVLEPTTGQLDVQGAVSSILELGAGFHPDFTGRQNIRINAAMLGLTERALENRLPTIEKFCELGDFLDRPVKVYSSGMSMRLAFAIATQVEPDILIIDEALSVGDGYFQKKCMDRVLELMAGGTSLLFCSHAMYYVSTLCQRVVWLRDGEVEAYGKTDAVVQQYEEFLLEQQAAGEASKKADSQTPDGEKEGRADSVGHLVAPRQQSPARITSVDLFREGREVLPEDGLRPDQALSIEIAWSSSEPLLNFQVGVGVDRMDGIQVFGLDTRDSGLSLVGKNRYVVRFELEKQPLLRGQFTVHAFLLDEKGLHVFDHRVLHDAFRVAPTNTYEFGMLRVPCRVKLLEPK